MESKTKLVVHERIQEFSSGGGGGVQVSLTKKRSDVLFFAFFLVISLLYRSQMVNFKAIYHFSRFQRGLTFSKGVQLFPGGGGWSNCLLPIETHITCDFPGGSGPPAPPPPPSGSALVVEFSLTPNLDYFTPTF